MQVADLLHAEPAELAAAHRARDVVAAAVVHFDDEREALGAAFDLLFVQPVVGRAQQLLRGRC